MKYLAILLLALCLPSMFISSCKKMEPQSQPNYYVGGDYVDDEGKPRPNLVAKISEITDESVKTLLLKAVDLVGQRYDCNQFFPSLFQSSGLEMKAQSPANCSEALPDQSQHFNITSINGSVRPNSGDILVARDHMIMVVDPENCIYLDANTLYYNKDGRMEDQREVKVRFSSLKPNDSSQCSFGVWKKLGSSSEFTQRLVSKAFTPEAPNRQSDLCGVLNLGPTMPDFDPFSSIEWQPGQHIPLEPASRWGLHRDHDLAPLYYECIYRLEEILYASLGSNARSLGLVEIDYDVLTLQCVADEFERLRQGSRFHLQGGTSHTNYGRYIASQAAALLVEFVLVKTLNRVDEVLIRPAIIKLRNKVIALQRALESATVTGLEEAGIFDAHIALCGKNPLDKNRSYDTFERAVAAVFLILPTEYLLGHFGVAAEVTAKAAIKNLANLIKMAVSRLKALPGDPKVQFVAKRMTETIERGFGSLSNLQSTLESKWDKVGDYLSYRKIKLRPSCTIGSFLKGMRLASGPSKCFPDLEKVAKKYADEIDEKNLFHILWGEHDEVFEKIKKVTEYKIRGGIHTQRAVNHIKGKLSDLKLPDIIESSYEIRENNQKLKVVLAFIEESVYNAKGKKQIKNAASKIPYLKMEKNGKTYYAKTLFPEEMVADLNDFMKRLIDVKKTGTGVRDEVSQTFTKEFDTHKLEVIVNNASGKITTSYIVLKDLIPWAN